MIWKTSCWFFFYIQLSCVPVFFTSAPHWIQLLIYALWIVGIKANATPERANALNYVVGWYTKKYDLKDTYIPVNLKHFSYTHELVKMWN